MQIDTTRLYKFCREAEAAHAAYTTAQRRAADAQEKVWGLENAKRRARYNESHLRPDASSVSPSQLIDQQIATATAELKRRQEEYNVAVEATGKATDVARRCLAFATEHGVLPADLQTWSPLS